MTIQTLEHSETATQLFDITPLQPSLGALISGIDLARPLDRPTYDALRAALLQYKVLFFRDQNLTREQHIALGAAFGDLEEHPVFSLPDYPQILPLISQELTGKYRQSSDSNWHADTTFRTEPSAASILIQRVSPSLGGDTVFANAVAAYETLDEETKARIDGLTATSRVDAQLTNRYKQILDEFIGVNAVPRTNIVKLGDVQLAQTGVAYYHEKFEQVLTQVQLDEPVMLIGPAGSGKNYAVSQVADGLGLPMYYTNNASNEFKLTGFIDAGGTYRDTQFYKAFKNGGVFFLDEIDNSDPSALIVINSALANGYMAFPHETIERHPDFRCVAAANTWGKGSNLQYVGRNVLDGATLDRFDMVFFDYDRKLERALYPSDELLEFMWSLRDAADDCRIPHIVSTRAIGKCFKKEAYGMDIETILRTNVIRSLTQDDMNMLVGAMKNIASDNKYLQVIKTIRIFQ